MTPAFSAYAIVATSCTKPKEAGHSLVDIESLAALDLLLWLGRGAEVSERLCLNQSTVSRKAGAAASTFAMALRRNKEGWELLGDPQLVRLERVVHQMHRVLTGQRLRLEADWWLGGTLLKGRIPDGWMRGRYHYLAHHQPLRLVRERILDCWLTALGNECRYGDTSDLVIIDLASLPLRLLVDHRHPLVFMQNLEVADLLHFPRTNLCSGVMPWFEAQIRHRGLWDSPITAAYYSPDDWEGRARDQSAILYGHAFTQELNPWLRVLDYELNLSISIALVLHRDLACHDIIDALTGWIKRKLAEKQMRHPELTLAGQGPEQQLDHTVR